MSSGDVSVTVAHKVLGVPDATKRVVTEEIVLTVEEAGVTNKIRGEELMRTYGKEEFESLVKSSGLFKVLAWHGPDFNIDEQIQPGREHPSGHGRH